MFNSPVREKRLEKIGIELWAVILRRGRPALLQSVMFYPPRDPHTRQVVWEIEYFFFTLLGSRATELQGGNRGVLRSSTQRERYTYDLAVWPYKEPLTHAGLTRLIHYTKQNTCRNECISWRAVDVVPRWNTKGQFDRWSTTTRNCCPACVARSAEITWNGRVGLACRMYGSLGNDGSSR